MTKFNNNKEIKIKLIKTKLIWKIHLSYLNLIMMYNFI